MNSLQTIGFLIVVGCVIAVARLYIKNRPQAQQGNMPRPLGSWTSPRPLPPTPRPEWARPPGNQAHIARSKRRKAAQRSAAAA